VTAALDSIDENGEITKIKADVARMNRLVDQLLRVARLDAVALDVSDQLDLNEMAADVVGSMAPWSLARKKPLRSTARTSQSSSKGIDTRSAMQSEIWSKMPSHIPR